MPDPTPSRQDPFGSGEFARPTARFPGSGASALCHASGVCFYARFRPDGGLAFPVEPMQDRAAALPPAGAQEQTRQPFWFSNMIVNSRSLRRAQVNSEPTTGGIEFVRPSPGEQRTRRSVRTEVGSACALAS